MAPPRCRAAAYDQGMRATPLLVLAVALGCSGQSSGVAAAPADVSGRYTVAVTSRENGCGFPNWTVGNTAENIPFDVTQTGADATGTVEGLTGTFLALWLGTRRFDGSVFGSTVTMTARGTNPQLDAGCRFTVDATIDGTLTGNALQGTIRYAAQTSGGPECAAKIGCASTQEFSGSRPPR